jgi:2,3-diketo-5-methylthiopentyl-1-phosphate enolase
VTDAFGFGMPESIELRDFVVATYLYRGDARVDIHRAARALADLQSTGTWVSVERETTRIRERHAARVLAIWEVPDHEADPPADDLRAWVLQIAYPAHNIGSQIPLLLATVYGECASGEAIRLLDLQLPETFVHAFRGPKFGLDGIRGLIGAEGRPLLFAIIKPAIGLSPTESAQVFYEAALGGADAVKDDELLVSTPWSTFADRAHEHGLAARRAFEETGHRTLYFVNITDRPDRLLANAYRAVEAGATGLLVDHVTVGVSALSMLADDPAVNVPILGHLAFAGGLYAAPWTGVSSHLVLGKLPRLAGADAVIYPNPYGSLRSTRSKHLAIARSMTDPFFGIPRIAPVAGGGIHPGMVPVLLGDLGVDHAVAAGGAVHGHPMGVTAGARAIRQAIEATVSGVTLAEFAAGHPELAAALELWPEVRPAGPGSPAGTPTRGH